MADDPTGRSTAGGPALIGLAALAGVAMVVRAVQPLLSGPDAFWHWDVGRRMVASRRLVDSDPYSFLTDDRSWVLNQWGADLLFGLVDHIGGSWLLSLCVVVLVSIGVMLTAHGAWNRAPSLLTVLLVGLAIAASTWNWHLRGHLFSLILLPLLLHELRRPPGPRPLRLLVLLAAWANLHGAFLVGLAMIGTTAVARWLAAGPGQRRQAVRSGVAMTGGALVGSILTPYGPTFLLDGLRLSGRAGGLGITEWAPPPLLDPVVLPFTALVALVLVCVAISATREAMVDVMLVVASVLLGFSALRNIAMASVALTILGAPHVLHAYDTLWHRRGRPTSPPTRLDRGVGALVLAGLFGVSVILVPRSTDPWMHTEDLPREIVLELAKIHEPRRVYADSLWTPGIRILGGDHVRTAVDGRVELFTPDEFSTAGVISSANPGFESALDRWCVTDVVVPEADVLSEALADHPAFELVMTDDTPADAERRAAWYSHQPPPQCG